MLGKFQTLTYDYFSQDQILLKIKAEISVPMLGDDIKPQRNTRRVFSASSVFTNTTFSEDDSLYIKQ